MRIAELQPVPNSFRDKENLVKHIRKRIIQTGRLFFIVTYSISFKKQLFQGKKIELNLSTPLSSNHRISQRLLREDEKNNLPV